EPPVLLIVEDDESFSRTLRKSFERRGYMVVSADGPDQMAEVLKIHRPGFAVVDLKLGGASGLGCVSTLHAFDADMNIVVLTGFASIATAVEAGQLDYEQTVASLWPAFGAAGKAGITVGQLMSHQAGLPGFSEAVDPSVWFEAASVLARLAAQAPMWEPGTASGYHPVTVGYM
ncbi:MAG: serine hydrolase, partial [Hyphomonas sp.]